MGGIKKSKLLRKLARRQAAWAQHGKNPRAPNNPSNDHGEGHDMHRPGSLNWRKH